MIQTTSSTTGPLPCNGVTTVFPFNYPVSALADLVVIHTTSLGVVTTLVLNSTFTAALSGTSGGSVTTTTAWPTGDTIEVARVVALMQPTSIRNQPAFFPEILENVFDRLTMQIQQLQDQITNLVGGVGLSVAKFMSQLSSSIGSSLVGYLAPYTGAVARTQSSRDADRISVFDFLTAAQISDVRAGTLGQDCTTAIQAAINAMLTRGGTLYFPNGYYKVSGQISIGSSLYTSTDYGNLVGRTGTVTVVPSAVNGAYNDANYLPINLEFAGSAYIVAATSWAPSVQTPVIEHNLRQWAGQGRIRGLKVITQACMTGTKYIWGSISNTGGANAFFPVTTNVYVPPTNKLIGLAYNGLGLNVIDDFEFAGLQTGVLGVMPYWSTLCNGKITYCNDGVNWNNGNATKLFNIRGWWCSRGMVIDGDALSCDTFHYENVLDGLIIYQGDASTYSNMYLEDDASTAALDGTGHSSVYIATASANTVSCCTFQNIRARSSRTNKKAFTINAGLASGTFIGCRAGTGAVTVNASATGMAINCDGLFNAAISMPKWSLFTAGLAATSDYGTGSAAANVGHYFYTYTATLGNITTDTNVTGDITVATLPAYNYATFSVTPYSGTDSKIMIIARIINSTTVRLTFQNTSAGTLTAPFVAVGVEMNLWL